MSRTRIVKFLSVEADGVEWMVTDVVYDPPLAGDQTDPPEPEGAEWDKTCLDFDLTETDLTHTLSKETLGKIHTAVCEYFHDNH